MYTPNELNHISWQCRRGMKELDILIGTFFEEDFLNQPEDIQRNFARLLEESDLMLFRWLLRGETPEDEGYGRVIATILECHEKRLARP
ncbi:MAG: succinate dehydrogenase assembly factor 2 [Succinivibrionaceae bacterium]|nr:succinate dehydrogenase assembly factor 2 [Succinivibrionaceae bacterium]